MFNQSFASRSHPSATEAHETDLSLGDEVVIENFNPNRRAGVVRRRVVSLLMVLGIMFGGFTAVGVATAPKAEAALIPGVNCAQLVQLAYRMPVVWQTAAAGFIGGACIGFSYSHSFWWNFNFDNVLNRCYTNCSYWELSKMVFVITYCM